MGSAKGPPHNKTGDTVSVVELTSQGYFQPVFTKAKVLYSAFCVLKMNILPLADIPSAVSKLAKWHFNEWQFLYPDDSVESFAADLSASICEQVVPSTFVAVDDHGEVTGSISLIEEDMGDFRDYTPWLASLYVAQDKRSLGIGKGLIQHLVSYAKQNGLPRLYLYTPDARSYYEGLGWQHLERTEYHGEQVDILHMTF